MAMLVSPAVRPHVEAVRMPRAVEPEAHLNKQDRERGEVSRHQNVSMAVHALQAQLDAIIWKRQEQQPNWQQVRTPVHHSLAGHGIAGDGRSDSSRGLRTGRCMRWQVGGGKDYAGGAGQCMAVGLLGNGGGLSDAVSAVSLPHNSPAAKHTDVEGSAREGQGRHNVRVGQCAGSGRRRRRWRRAGAGRGWAGLGWAGRARRGRTGRGRPRTGRPAIE